jgi:hypothetical protein
MNKRNKRENAKREITRQGNVEERERMREKKIKKIERMIAIMRRRREEKKQK